MPFKKRKKSMSDEARGSLGVCRNRKREESFANSDDDSVHIDTLANDSPTINTVSKNKLVKKIDSECSVDSESDSESELSDGNSDSGDSDNSISEYDNECEDSDANDDRIGSSDGIRLWDWLELQKLLDATSVCNRCKVGQLIMKETDGRRQGWCSFIGLQCTNQDCDRHTDYDVVPTSPLIDMKAVINLKSVLAMRSIGRGREAAERFSGFLGLPPPVTNAWKCYTTSLAEVTRQAATDVMKDCGNAIRGDTDVKDTPVSVDGAWQSRGMTSNLGFVSTISAQTGEILDIHLMNNHCQKCQSMSHLDKYSAEYQEFYAEHFEECDINHEGSSASMESEGVSTLWSRSLEKHSLRYNPFIGDGDSKSYKKVCKDKPYGKDIVITKEECIGHVQKRMGTRMRNVLKKHQGIKLSDGKGLGGLGRLTLQRIDYFQRLYGNAIRDNKGNAQEMSRQTKAILKHYSDPADHTCCIPEKCSYLRDPENHKPIQKALPPAVVSVIQPVFDDLSNPKLLDGCTNLQTQNRNESFHHCVWGFVPKEQYQTMDIMTLGMYMAVLVYNRGYVYAARKLLQGLGLTVANCSLQIFERVDKTRIGTSTRQAGEHFRDRRTMRRQGRRKRQDAFKHQEGVMYKSGMMHEQFNNPSKPKSTRAPPKCKTCGVLLKGSGHKRGKLCPSANEG